jgi:hypothetical protein
MGRRGRDQSDDRRPEKGRRRLPSRWGTAGIVGCVHFTGAWAALNWRRVEATPALAAVMIDLAPLAELASAAEVAPGPVTELNLPTPRRRPRRNA